MKQKLIYSALFSFALVAAAPVAMAHDHNDDRDDRTMDSGAYQPGTNTDTHSPTDPRDPSNVDGAGSSGAGGGGGTGTGTGAGTGSGTGAGTSGGAGSTGSGTGGAGSGGASGAGAGAGG